MSSFYVFTYEELKKIDTDNLKKLAKYLNVSIPNKVRHEKLVELIYDKQQEMKKNDEFYVSNDGTPQYSVRVRRIMESQRKEA